MTTVNGVTYTWDNNGNLLNDGTRAYTYDQANRLKTVTQGPNNYAFAYNGLGDRLSQTVKSKQTRYVLDPSTGLTQVLADGTNTYLYANGRLAQYERAMQYFGADGLGSVRQLYNTSAQIIANTRYDPFGQIISQSGAATSAYGFTGEWTDATGLEYLRARYYAPWQGRFVTKDAWEGDSNVPMSQNSWLYVYANPVNHTDPSGMKSVVAIPRAYGICREPPASNRATRSELFVIQDDVFIYCGEFQLTAYQFISGEELYDRSQTATALNVQDQQTGARYETSSYFAEDVETNGTGFSNNAILTQTCGDGYFYFYPQQALSTHPDDTPATFRLRCGRGRPFDPVTDAFKVVAANRAMFQGGEQLLVLFMFLREPRYLTVKDTGGDIAQYQLDVFVGQGPGILSGRANYSSVPALIWSRDHSYLGTSRVTRPSGAVSDAVGPTSVYQRVPPFLAPVYEQIYCTLLDFAGLASR